MAKDLFNEKKVAYEEYDVAADLEKRKEMVEKSGQLGVPVIDIGGKIMVGYDKAAIEQALGL